MNDEPEHAQPPSTDDGLPLRADHVLCAILLSVMALIAFANVLSRYLFHYSFAFTEEITINCFVWLMVVGSGLAFERGSQLGMVSLFNLFPRKMQKTVVILGACLSAGLYVIVNVFLIQAIRMEITVFRAKSPALGIPIWIYYAGVLPASLFVFRGILRGALRELKPWKPSSSSPSS